MSNSRRIARVAQALREVVSTAILFELRDPRVKKVTVLSVEVAGDLRTAKVYVSIMGDEKEQKLTMHGLDSSRGFVQKRIADRLDLRWTPVLTFIVDDGIKKSLEASRILHELALEREAEEGTLDSDLELAPDDDSPSGEPSDVDLDTPTATSESSPDSG